jgi:hypothetical protein
MNIRHVNPDEFVLEDIQMVHYEVMNENSIWIGIYANNGKIYHLNIGTKDGKLMSYYSDESSE